LAHHSGWAEAIRDCEYLATKGIELPPNNTKAGSALCGAATNSSSSIATADSAVFAVCDKICCVCCCDKIQIQIGLVHLKCHLLSGGIKAGNRPFEGEKKALPCLSNGWLYIAESVQILLILQCSGAVLTDRYYWCLHVQIRIGSASE
jgi:hypothetical protein